jgi:hypothetical protein
MEAVFRKGSFWIFPVTSGRFPTGKEQKVGWTPQENPETFRLEYCFQVSVISRVLLPKPACTLGLSMANQTIFGKSF